MRNYGWFGVSKSLMAGLARSWFLLHRQCDVWTGRVLHRASMAQLSGVRLRCERAPLPNSCLRRQTRNSWCGVMRCGRPARKQSCQEFVPAAARVVWCDMRLRVSLFVQACAIATTAGRNLVVSSSFTLNGECQTSRSLGKLKRTMDAGFVRHAGQGSSKLIPNLLR